MRRLVAAQAGLAVQAFGFIEVAAHLGHALFEKEVEERVGLGKGIGRHHRDGMEGDAGFAQPRHAAQHPVVRATPAAGLAVSVVQGLRTIDADAHLDSMALEQVAPGIVDQGGVGLDRVRDPTVGPDGRCDGGDGLVVIRHRHDQRLAGMPHHGERLAQQAVFTQSGGGALGCGQAHACGGLAIRQVAVIAIDVAERRGLQDQQPGLEGRRKVGDLERRDRRLRIAQPRKQTWEPPDWSCGHHSGLAPFNHSPVKPVAPVAPVAPVGPVVPVVPVGPVQPLRHHRGRVAFGALWCGAGIELGAHRQHARRECLPCGLGLDLRCRCRAQQRSQAQQEGNAGQQGEAFGKHGSSP